MKITLVFSDSRNIGLEYLAAVLKKKGHQVSLVFDPLFLYRLGNRTLSRFLEYSQIVKKKILDSRPDLIGFSVLSDTYPWALKLAKLLKKTTSTPIIFGGLHATSVPEIILQENCVDYVCVGEGEEAMLDLCSALEQGKDTSIIPNIWTKKGQEIIKNNLRPLLTDLDTLPFPEQGCAYHSLKHLGYFGRYYIVLTSRGCPYCCSFCINSILHKLYGNSYAQVRLRSTSNVMEELQIIKNTYKIKSFCFGDDVFTFNQSWLNDFSKKYKEEINLPFLCQSHPNFITPEAVKTLEEAGCQTMVLGLETLDPNLSLKILNRQISFKKLKETFSILKKSRIFFFTDILLSFPGQDEGELLNIAKFLNRSRPDGLIMFNIRYYPKMPITELALERNILSSNEVKKIEESKEYIPFLTGSRLLYHSVQKNLVALLFISPFLPRSLFNFILHKKLYKRKLPGFNYLSHFYVILVNLSKKIFSPKKKIFLVAFPALIKYFCYYINQKIIFKIRVKL